MMAAWQRGLTATILVFAIATGGLALAGTADGSVTDPDAAWQHYLSQDRDLAPGYQFPHATCFRAAAVTYGLPETLLLAVARGESDFNATARSRANAHGVMQIQWPGTAQHLGIHRLTELYDPCTNIDAGARYLQELLGRFNGNLHLALAAYNYGPERISRNPDDIPEGARWYSAYIFRHLGYVLGERRATPDGSQHLYSDLGRTTLMSFGEPYRAAAFVERLETHAPALQLDWFRRGVGQFAVVLTYADRDQFAASARLLAQAGFPLE
jgi:hypothetical protein